MTNLPDSHLSVAELAERLKLPTDVRKQVNQLLKDFPRANGALEQLLGHFYYKNTTESNDSNATAEPIGMGTKKRKVNGEDSSVVAAAIDDSKPQFAIRDLMFQAPRKKLDLILTSTSLRLQQTASSVGDAETTAATVELWLPFKDIRRAILLPTPNKPKKHYSLVLIVENCPEPAVLLQFADDKPVMVVESLTAASVDQKLQKPTATGSNRETLVSLLHSVIGNPPIEPNEAIFLSRYPAVVQKSRDVKQYHVDCHIKAKDGQLFFLHDCLLFGFRKPILFMDHKDILSMQVQSITSRTFDLAVQVRTADGGKVTHEFGMVDQCEFDVIMAYIARYRLKGPSVPLADGTDRDSAKSPEISGNNSSPASTTDRVVAAASELANPLAYLNPNNPIADEDEDESEDEDYVESGSSDSGDYSDSSSDSQGDGGSSDFDEEDEESDDVDDDDDDITMSSGN